MSSITFITGGQRSGKSRYAQQLALELADNPIYLATARRWDEDFNQRIKRHQNDRGLNWQNLEVEKHIGELSLNGQTVLLDCITLWLTNLFHDNQFQTEPTLVQAKDEWQRFAANEGNLIVVSNELGMGIHAEHETARKFTDLQGWMNQYIAAQAQRVILMVSGIPITIKEVSNPSINPNL